LRVLREPSVRVVAYQECCASWKVVFQGGAQNGPAPTKMIIHLEGAHAFCVSIFAELSTFLRSRGSDLPLSLRVLVSSRMEEIELGGRFSRRLLPFPCLPAAVAGVVNEREFLHS
jgi:hypothetical protein